MSEDMGSEKVLVSPPTAAQMEADKARDERIAKLEALVKAQTKVIDNLKGVQTTGEVTLIHCNICGAEAPELGPLPCGHSELVNHVGPSGQLTRDGNIGLNLVKQTSAIGAP